MLSLLKRKELAKVENILLVVVDGQAEWYNLTKEDITGSTIEAGGRTLPQSRMKRFALTTGGLLFVIGLEYEAAVSAAEFQQIRRDIAAVDLFQSPVAADMGVSAARYATFVMLVVAIINLFITFGVNQNMGKLDAVIKFLAVK